MSDEFKNTVKVACIYATSIIGAGFASGQEIMQFFSTYKAGGFYGVLLAGFFFSVIGCIVLDKIYTERIKNYEELIFPTFGWWVGWIVEIAVTLFIFFMFSIMIAGSANVLSERLGISLKYAALFMGAICMLLIFTDIKGIVMLSSFITPVLIIGIILAGLYIIVFSEHNVSGISGYLSRMTGNWFFSSILYVSYNSILAIIMMCSMQPYIKTRRIAIAGGILGGAALSLAALVINTVIFMFYPSVLEKELPIIDILRSFSSSAGSLYAILLWLAMLISAVTSGFCFADRAGNTLKINKRIVTVILCGAAVPLSTLGFSRLISMIYPMFGYLGLFMIIVLFISRIIKRQSTGRYSRK